MNLALLIVFAVGVVAYVVFGAFKKQRQDLSGADNNVVKKPEEKNCADTEACGVSCFCDDKALRRQISEEIIYFEDEELDAFKGINADEYSEEQIEVFSEVLSTLRTSEVPDWLHSLELRNIALPTPLKEEAMMMMQ